MGAIHSRTAGLPLLRPDSLLENNLRGLRLVFPFSGIPPKLREPVDFLINGFRRVCSRWLTGAGVRISPNLRARQRALAREIARETVGNCAAW